MCSYMCATVHGIVFGEVWCGMVQCGVLGLDMFYMIWYNVLQFGWAQLIILQRGEKRTKKLNDSEFWWLQYCIGINIQVNGGVTS